MKNELAIIQDLYNERKISFVTMQKAERLVVYKCMTKRNIKERELNALRDALKESCKLVEDGEKMVILCRDI